MKGTGESAVKSIIKASDAKQIEEHLASLATRINALQVTDQTTYTSALELIKEGRSYLKDVAEKLDPFIRLAKKGWDDARAEKAKWTGPAEAVLSVVETRASRWISEERAAAKKEEERLAAELKRKQAQEAETKRIEDERIAKEALKKRIQDLDFMLANKEINKREYARLLKEAGATAEAEKAAAEVRAEEAKNAPPPEVKVAPNIPTLAGTRRLVVPKWRMKNIDAVPRALLYPNDINKVENFPRITQEVKRLKDRAKVEAAIPGIEYYEDDSI